jgi:hypothetical protein
MRSGICRAVAVGAAILLGAAQFTPALLAQRRQDWDWDGNTQRLSRLNAGTYVTVRTTASIDSNRRDGRVYAGVVNDDVWDDYKRLSTPAIPRGSRVDLVVRTARDGDLILDLASIYAYGQRYTVEAMPERVDSDNRNRGSDAAAFAGGGAILGTIIGSIAGGGKGAAIGAAAGAATGLGIALQGKTVRVPAGSVLTFRLDSPLEISGPSRLPPPRR